MLSSCILYQFCQLPILQRRRIIIIVYNYVMTLMISAVITNCIHNGQIGICEKKRERES